MPLDLLPALAAHVDALAAVDVDRLSVPALQELIAQGALLAGRIQGVVSGAVGELAVRGAGKVPAKEGGLCPLPAWLRETTKVSGVRAGQQARAAMALRELPAVGVAVLDVTTTEVVHAARRLTGGRPPRAE